MNTSHESFTLRKCDSCKQTIFQTVEYFSHKCSITFRNAKIALVYTKYSKLKRWNTVYNITTIWYILIGNFNSKFNKIMEIIMVLLAFGQDLAYLYLLTTQSNAILAHLKLRFFYYFWSKLPCERATSTSFSKLLHLFASLYFPYRFI